MNILHQGLHLLTITITDTLQTSAEMDKMGGRKRSPSWWVMANYSGKQGEYS